MTIETVLRELGELEKKATAGPWYATFDEAIKVNSKSDGLLAICTNLKNGYSRRPTDEVEINAKLIAALRNAFPEIAEGMRDAARYRWLADADNYPYDGWWSDKVGTALTKEALDAAIDAARAKEESR